MSYFKGFGDGANGQRWYGDYGFLYKKRGGGGGRRNPSFGLICNRPANLDNTYAPGGSGVGASSISNRRAKNRRATSCEKNKCAASYNRLGIK